MSNSTSYVYHDGITGFHTAIWMQWHCLYLQTASIIITLATINQFLSEIAPIAELYFELNHQLQVFSISYFSSTSYLGVRVSRSRLFSTNCLISRISVGSLSGTMRVQRGRCSAVRTRESILSRHTVYPEDREFCRNNEGGSRRITSRRVSR